MTFQCEKVVATLTYSLSLFLVFYYFLPHHSFVLFTKCIVCVWITYMCWTKSKVSKNLNNVCFLFYLLLFSIRRFWSNHVCIQSTIDGDSIQIGFIFSSHVFYHFAPEYTNSILIRKLDLVNSLVVFTWKLAYWNEC